MRLRSFAQVGWAFLLLLFLSVAAQASAGGNCVAYARDASGIHLDGNAAMWWPHAEGRYERGNQPAVGAVLVFKPSRAMHVGHVAVVSRIVGPREILVDQANWIPGRVSKAMSVVDASPANDWTSVKVMEPHSGKHGRENPTYGFIYSQPVSAGTALASAAPPPEHRQPTRLARAEQATRDRAAPSVTAAGGRAAHATTRVAHREIARAEPPKHEAVASAEPAHVASAEPTKHEVVANAEPVHTASAEPTRHKVTASAPPARVASASAEPTKEPAKSRHEARSRPARPVQIAEAEPVTQQATAPPAAADRPAEPAKRHVATRHHIEAPRVAQAEPAPHATAQHDHKAAVQVDTLTPPGQRVATPAPHPTHKAADAKLAAVY